MPQQLISDFVPKKIRAHELGQAIEQVASVGFTFAYDEQKRLKAVMVEYETGQSVDLNGIRAVIEAHELGEDGKDDFERAEEALTLEQRVAALEAAVAALQGD